MDNLPVEIMNVLGRSFSVKLEGVPDCHLLMEQLHNGDFNDDLKKISLKAVKGLQKVGKENLEISRIGWSLFLENGSKIKDGKQREKVNEAIFYALKSAAATKRWDYLGMVFHELKSQSFNLGSVIKYNGNLKVSEQSWTQVLASMAYKGPPEPIIFEWFSVRQVCEHPHLLENKMNVFKQDLDVLSPLSPKGLKHFCAAANKFYGINDWLWEASCDVFKKDADHPLYNKLNFLWLKTWKELISQQGFELTKNEEDYFQERIFLKSLLEGYPYKPKPELLPLPTAFDIYVKTLCLSSLADKKSESPFENPKGITLASLLKLYSASEVKDLWADKKEDYADFIKKSLSAKWDEWAHPFNNKFRFATVLSNVLEVFPEDKDLFLCKKSIEECGRSGIFYAPGGFHLIELLMSLGVPLNKEMFDPEEKMHNPEVELKDKLQRSWLQLELKKSVKTTNNSLKKNNLNDVRF